MKRRAVFFTGVIGLGMIAGTARAQMPYCPDDAPTPKTVVVQKVLNDKENAAEPVFRTIAVLCPPQETAETRAPTSAPAQRPPRENSASPAANAPVIGGDPSTAPPLTVTSLTPQSLTPEVTTRGLLDNIVGGAAVYVVRPYLSNNTAYRTTNDPGAPQSAVSDSTFHWSYAPAGAIWLGWAPERGLGVRARYFFFDQASTTTTVINGTTPAPLTQTTINPPLGDFLPLSTGGTAFGSPGTVLNTGIGTDVLAFSSSLQIKAIDLEATYGWTGAGWSILASAGARYQTLDQAYHASLTNNGGGQPVSEEQLFDATRSFSGTGPVLGLLGNLRIGQSGFSLFASLRGAVLVGSSVERVGFQQTVVDPTGLIPPGVPGTLQLAPTAARNADRVLSVAEVELGIQYDLNLARSSLFLRAGAVNHNYFDVGNASQANGNLSLFGVQFAAGLRY